MTVGIQQIIQAEEAVLAALHDALYRRGDLAAALDAFADDGTLAHVPAGTGGTGRAELERHLAADVLPHLPADLAVRRLSRTADQRRVVDETVVSFTHDRELPWLLPGVAATHRPAEVLAVTVTAFRHRSWQGATTSRIAAQRTLWDDAGMRRQLGV